MATYLGGYDLADGKMKEKGTIHWSSPNYDATNASGFTGLPESGRDYDGTFLNIGYGGNWWDSSEFNSLPFYYNLYYFGNSLTSICIITRLAFLFVASRIKELFNNYSKGKPI